MTPMLLGPAEIAALADVRATAEAHPIALGVLQLIAAGHLDVPTARPEWGLGCVIPVGFRVCFTIEHHPPPAGWCRHFSMSAARKDRLPHPIAAQSIMAHLGMAGAYEDCHVYTEELPGGGAALNVVEKIRGVPPHLEPERP